MSEKNCGIIEAMCWYASRKPARMHMPGHKGKGVFSGGLVSMPADTNPEWARRLLDELRVIDMTESPGLDNLHYPSGCIREVERRAEKLFGSARSYILVNGATSGVQASLLAARMVLGARSVLVPRNAHRSMMTAMAMSGLEPVFVWPEHNPNLGGYLPLDVERIKEAFEREVACGRRPPKAVVVINPTYCGFARNISEIAEIAHANGAILIVDEAHGTHFKVGRELPPSALDCGADLVVHGAHKTTVAFTQTAFLHVGPSAPERFPGLIPAVEESLRAVQTTSPSYILMASLQQAIEVLERDGGQWVNRGVERACELSRRLARIPGLSVVGYDPSNPVPPGLMHDPGRILVNLTELGVTGPQAARFLVEEERVDPEMVGPRHILMIWTGADSDEDVDTVEAAFRALAERCPREHNSQFDASLLLGEAPRPARVMSLREAFLSMAEAVDLDQAAGRISADTVVVYPPGAPLITPGEEFDSATVEYITNA
ncbi:MAG TPA: aminotransferase class I/II-fold pyridoxal phosphate-dependent enzyme, partial [Firmicutes bacterium]|nr:aminotransferase class I/II-fold pyridoxal phosphate-dependent enzyme [Candidatus Fermentithermobacillaceae bacterium]